MSGRLLIPTWGLPVTLLQISPSTAHWGPGGQGQALCSGQEGPGLRQVIPCEVHVRGCGTRRSGYPGMVPGPRLVGIELATSRGLCRTHGDVKVHPASKQELPVSLQPEATSHRIARKSAMPPARPDSPLRRNIRELDSHKRSVCPPTGRAPTTFSTPYHEYPAADAQLNKGCWQS